MLDKGSMTPEERSAQEVRMQRFLNDSSPRNMNEEPKVTPELTQRFTIPRGSVHSESGTAQASTAAGSTQEKSEQANSIVESEYRD